MRFRRAAQSTTHATALPRHCRHRACTYTQSAPEYRTLWFEAMNIQPQDISFERTLAALACAFVAGLCACTPSSGRLYQWGTMKSALRDGKTEARIDLSELTRHPHCYAVGALAGLEGEVVVIDGAAWVTRSDGVTTTTTQALPEHNEAATLLTAAYVPNWSAITVEHDQVS